LAYSGEHSVSHSSKVGTMPNARKIVNLGIATPAYNNTVLMSYANTLFGI